MQNNVFFTGPLIFLKVTSDVISLRITTTTNETARTLHACSRATTRSDLGRPSQLIQFVLRPCIAELSQPSRLHSYLSSPQSSMSDDENKDLAPEQEESTPDTNIEVDDNAGAKPNGEGKGRKKSPEVPIEQLYDLSKPIPKVRSSEFVPPSSLLVTLCLCCVSQYCDLWTVMSSLNLIRLFLYRFD
jgi:hypothetical protein